MRIKRFEVSAYTNRLFKNTLKVMVLSELNCFLFVYILSKQYFSSIDPISKPTGSKTVYKSFCINQSCLEEKGMLLDNARYRIRNGTLVIASDGNHAEPIFLARFHAFEGKLRPGGWFTEP